ncbi:MAG: hypothetical protein [Olavius algarvensis Gamma 1 endosymbiont]|nr:MAG: hypothetical protein [Olavius algarvensis Gamma 1 endosymbiont]
MQDLGFKSQKRHEMDLSIRSEDEAIFRTVNKRYSQARSTLARAKFALRRFLLWVYVRSH